MSVTNLQSYFVIPLSIQKDGDTYLVGNAEIGDFYQFPESAVTILDMVKSGRTLSEITSHISADEDIDVADFIEQLISIGFIYPMEQSDLFWKNLKNNSDNKRILNINPRIAGTIFSPITLIIYVITVGYALYSAYYQPSLRVNWQAFYTDEYRSGLLVAVILLSLIDVVVHELSHMIAAAKYGVRSKYGLGNRLWTIVAETDLTGIMSLPKRLRYFPLLAGMMADILLISLITLLIGYILNFYQGFGIQILQALILQILSSLVWQFNVFVKTDIYFVLCTYFNYPDLDKDARIYLRRCIYRLTAGRFGASGADLYDRHIGVLRLFSVVWLIGRTFSFAILFGVYLPTIIHYIVSAAHSFSSPGESAWVAYDTITFALISLTMTGVGMYTWLRQRKLEPVAIGENNGNSVS